jgi:DNA-binding NtrC family response regulator
MEIYKAFLRKQKKGYHVDLPTGMVTAVVADQASGEGDKIKMQEVLAQIARYSAHDSTVLITGENGTGKELVARAICQLSSRKNSPFVDLNCAAIPETLIESELFGHVRGAFTNAISDRAGAFEQADGGIIFLDEIGDLKPELQAKLLRVLQEKKVRRVGSNRSVEVNVRVITATNRDLQKLIEEGKFRIDLYFRLNVANIHLPPLRERKEDIPHLIHYFLDNFNKNEQGRKHLTEEALIAMICYDWPGNIRELQNIVERLCIDALEDTIQLKDLPAEIQESYHAATKGMPLWEIIEAATQAEMKHLMTVCQDILRLGNGEEAPPSGRLEIHGKACENCYDYITTFIDSQASVFPQDKREKLAKQVIVAMKEELFAWCKDEALGKMEQLCEKIEKLLGRTRRMIDNWKREVGFPLFYSPQ